MNVPFLNLSATYDELKTKVDKGVTEFLLSGQYILGDYVIDFENQYAEYVSAKFCVGVSNGLDALILSLRALGIGLGDEVIVPSNTFIATWLAVSQVEATLVPVEPNMETYLIEADEIEKHITKRTKAIIVVHLYGNPVNMIDICSLARRYNLKVIEDAAQAHGSEIAGERIGSHGDIVCWSFYPGKNLGAFGDGGAITTNEVRLADKVRLLRNYGSTIKYVHTVMGVNNRLDSFQAMILSIKLPFLDDWNDRRQKIADIYLKELAGLPVVLPKLSQLGRSSWHLFVIRVNKRDLLKEFLSERGIQTLIHYPIPPYKQKAYEFFANYSLPICDELSSTSLSLPIGPHMSIAEVNYVIQNIKEYFSEV